MLEGDPPNLELAASRSTPDLPSTVAAALDRLRQAQTVDERARAGDWRRSVVSPAVVLRPLYEAVLGALAECRQLGVPEDLLRAP